jgi:hypothetical protein
MAEKVGVAVVDEEVTEVVEHFEMLTIEQMRKALEGIKLSLENKEREERFALTIEKKFEAMKVKVGAAPPEYMILLLDGILRRRLLS